MAYNDNYQSYGGDGDAGGGFMQGVTSPASGSQAKGMQRPSVVTPVFIYQVTSATQRSDDSLLIDDRDVGQVVVVGVVRTFDQKATKLTYSIEDHTGTVDVVQWVEADSDEEGMKKLSEIREGMYVRAVGPVKTFSERRQITAYHVAPVSCPDEITCHYLDALHKHLLFTKGSKNAPARAQQAAAAHVTAPSKGIYGAAVQTSHASNGFTPAQNAVISAIRACNEDQGVSVQELVGSMRGRFTEVDIRKTIEWLSSEGHVYSTVDDEHFKSTEAQ